MRTEQLNIKMHEGEKRLVQARAQSLHMSASEYARLVLLNTKVSVAREIKRNQSK